MSCPEWWPSYIFHSQHGLSDFPIENGSDYQVRLDCFPLKSVESNISICINELTDMSLVVFIGDETDQVRPGRHLEGLSKRSPYASMFE